MVNYLRKEKDQITFLHIYFFKYIGLGSIKSFNELIKQEMQF